jgi:hypothetical protein
MNVTVGVCCVCVVLCCVVLCCVLCCVVLCCVALLHVCEWYSVTLIYRVFQCVSYTVVPPYPLIQYPWFQLSAVYQGLKKNWKLKEINGSQVTERAMREWSVTW